MKKKIIGLKNWLTLLKANFKSLVIIVVNIFNLEK